MLAFSPRHLLWVETMLPIGDERVTLDPVVDLALEIDEASDASAVGISQCVISLDELLPRARLSQTLIDLSNLVGPPGLPDVLGGFTH